MLTALGLSAGLLTTSCWAPQLVRSYRTRSTLDISWAYIAALGGGIVLWLTYGIFSHDPALIATNVATSGAIVTLVVFKRRFDRAERMGSVPAAWRESIQARERELRAHAARIDAEIAARRAQTSSGPTDAPA